MMNNIAASFTYVTLWTAFQHLFHMYSRGLGHAKCKDQSLALRLAALNMGFFAFEAFINHLIQAIRPAIWADERRFFSGRQPIGNAIYCGPMGKLQFLYALCERTFDNSTPDIETLESLKFLRDMMAHGRSYYAEPPTLAFAQLPEDHMSEIFEVATHQLLVSCDLHVGAMRLSLFDDATQHFAEADLGPHPRASISGMQSVSVSLKTA
jgi:hypothetical protein